MTTRNAKGSSSALNLSEENTSQVDFFNTNWRTKRQREEVETPAITVNTTFNSNLVTTTEYTQSINAEIIQRSRIPCIQTWSFMR